VFGEHSGRHPKTVEFIAEFIKWHAEFGVDAHITGSHDTRNPAHTEGDLNDVNIAAKESLDIKNLKNNKSTELPPDYWTLSERSSSVILDAGAARRPDTNAVINAARGRATQEVSCNSNLI
jgi:hypothetical protein